MSERTEISFDAALMMALRADAQKELDELPTPAQLEERYPDTSRWDARLQAALHKRRPVLKRVLVAALTLVILTLGALAVSADFRKAVYTMIQKFLPIEMQLTYQVDGEPLEQLPNGYSDHYVPDGYERDREQEFERAENFLHVYSSKESGKGYTVRCSIIQPGQQSSFDNEHTTYENVKVGDADATLGSLVLIFMIAMLQTLSTFAASGGGNKFEIVDSEYGIYRLSSSRARLATNTDSSLIEDNGSYYICLQDGLYAKAQKRVFSKNSSLATLRPETRKVVRSIFEKCEESGAELLNNTVEVYIPINEDMLSQSSLMATSTFPVTNEQVRYTSVGGEQVIKSGTNAFQSYATTVIDNIAKTVIGGVVSKINPYVGVISTIANLFPSKYNEVRSYTDWTFGVKLQEEKVVQLSWVYVANSPYLGAQTQFATIRYLSILTKGLQPSITDTSSYLYYRTPHYQSPETIARQHYTDTWVEQILSYPIDGIDVKSLA